jgi:hypothetical protein
MRQQFQSKLRASFPEVFAVVQDEQQLFRPDKTQYDFEQGLIRGRAQSKRLSDELQDEIRLVQRREVHQPDAICKGFTHNSGNLDRQAGLACSSDTSESDKASGGEQIFHCRQISLTPDKTRQLHG